VGVDGGLAGSDNVYGRKCLVSIDDRLGLALLELVAVGVEDALGEGLGVKEWDDVGGDEGVEALVELAAPASILEGGQESTLVLLERVVYVERRQVLNPKSFSQDLGERERVDIIEKRRLIS
jgi:hypothetical protein